MRVSGNQCIVIIQFVGIDVGISDAICIIFPRHGSKHAPTSPLNF